jgi:hypothetical protein
MGLVIVRGTERSSTAALLRLLRAMNYDTILTQRTRFCAEWRIFTRSAAAARHAERRTPAFQPFTNTPSAIRCCKFVTAERFLRVVALLQLSSDST